MLAGPDPGSAHVRAAYAATKGKATIVNEPQTQRSSKRAMPLSASQIRGWIRSSAPPTVNYAAICASTEHITALSKMRAVLARSMCEATDWFSADDVNGDGLLSREEFRDACEGLRCGVSISVSDALFDEMDVDRSNGISEREFVRFVLRDTCSRKAERVVNMLWKMRRSGESFGGISRHGRVEVRRRPLWLPS